MNFLRMSLVKKLQLTLLSLFTYLLKDVIILKVIFSSIYSTSLNLFELTLPYLVTSNILNNISRLILVMRHDLSIEANTNSSKSISPLLS